MWCKAEEKRTQARIEFGDYKFQFSGTCFWYFAKFLCYHPKTALSLSLSLASPLLLFTCRRFYPAFFFSVENACVRGRDTSHPRDYLTSSVSCISFLWHCFNFKLLNELKTTDKASGFWVSSSKFNTHVKEPRVAIIYGGNVSSRSVPFRPANGIWFRQK